MVKRVTDLNAYSKKLENFNASLNEVSDEILDKTAEVNLLHAELQKANETRDRLMKENAELTEIITELQENHDQESLRLTEYENQLCDLQKTYEAAKGESEQLCLDLELSKEELRNLRELKNSLDKTLRETQSQLISRENELKLEIDGLREALLVSENEKIFLQKQLPEEINSKYESELNEWQRKCEIFENECQTLHHDVETLHSELQKCREEYDSLDRELQETRDQFCAREEKLKIEIDRLRGKLRIFESEKESENEINLKHESELSRDREKYEILENECEALRRDLEYFENQLQRSKEINDSLDRELQKTRDQFCTREENVKTEMEYLRDALKIIETEKNAYYYDSQEEIKSKNETIAALNDRERSFAREIQSLSSKFSEEIDSLTSKINALDDQKQTLKINIENILRLDDENCGAKLRSIIETLRNQLSSSAEDQIVWQKVEELIERLGSENSERSYLEANDRIRATEELNSNYVAENENLRKRIFDLENESKQLNNYSDGLKNNITDLENRLGGIVSEREQLIVSLKVRSSHFF